jgi:hypothetical protein
MSVPRRRLDSLSTIPTATAWYLTDLAKARGKRDLFTPGQYVVDLINVFDLHGNQSTGLAPYAQASVTIVPSDQ